MLTPDVLDYIDRSVLCWLATADREGRPNVSPKEVFAAVDSSHVAVANIASPGTIRNLRQNPHVCLSFVEIFVQKGYKLLGRADIVAKSDPRYASLCVPLTAITRGVFPIHNVIDIEVTAVEPIVAPSYRMVPGTTEQSQITSAMESYGVRRKE